MRARFGNLGGWLLLVLGVLGSELSALAQPAVPPPPTTTYTRSLLRSTNAGIARTNLGILSTNGIVTGLMPDNTTAINNGDGSFSVVFPSQTNGFGNIVFSNAAAFSTRTQSTNDAAWQAKLATNALHAGALTGTLPDATFPTVLPARDASALTNIVFAGSSFVGSFTGNGAAITNHLRAETVLRPRQTGGVGRSTGTYQTTANNSAYMLISDPGTRGIVRELWVMWHLNVVVPAGTNIGNVNLRVYADSNLTVDLPVNHIIGDRYRFPSNGHWQINRHSEFVDSVSASTNELYAAEIFTFRWKFPMPFTNGVYAQLWNTHSNNAWPYGYAWGSVENGDPDTDFGNYRLRSASFNGAVTTSGSNFLLTARGPGIAAGWLQGWLMTNDVDGSLVSFLDSKGVAMSTGGGGSVPAGEWAGIGDGDNYGNTLAFAAAGLSFGPDFGCINYMNGLDGAYAGTLAIEAYRWFKDSTFTWTSGVNAYIRDTGSGQYVNRMYFDLIYYAP